MLLLCAARMEADALFPDRQPDGLPVEVVGVGPVEAALGTRRAIEKHRPDSVCFLGTAGTYRQSELAVGSTCFATDVLFATGSSLSGETRIPEIQPVHGVCDSRVGGEVLCRALPSARVVCTEGITENDLLAERLSALGDLENLELFGVCRAVADIPVGGVLAITNIVGEGGGAGWAANFRPLLARLGAEIMAGRSNQRNRIS